MSTRCAAKNLFLYYRKYVSEHICNKLLWEHIPGILFTERTQVRSRLDGGLWSITSHPCLLPTFPDTHSVGKSVQPDLPAFARSLYIRLWIFLLPLWFCLKGTVISSTPFSPLLSPCSAQAKVTLFAKPNLVPGERIWGKRLPCSPWPPPLLLGAPHAGSIRRAPVLQTASQQLKLFQQSRWQRNAWGKRQFLTDTISCLQIGCQQCSSFILASDKTKWLGDVGPHRRNLKSKTFTAEQNQSFLVTPLFSSQKWRAL